MNTTQPTAREQFTHDCMLVLENNRTSYEHIMKEAKRLNSTGEPVNLTTYRLAEFLKDYIETSILKALKQRPSDWTASVGTILVAEICNGYGIDPFYDMAKDFMQTATESAGV